MLYDSKLSHKAADATKNISCAKGEGAATRFSRNFIQVAKISMISKGQIGLKS